MKNDLKTLAIGFLGGVIGVFVFLQIAPEITVRNVVFVDKQNKPIVKLFSGKANLQTIPGEPPVLSNALIITSLNSGYTQEPIIMADPEYITDKRIDLENEGGTVISPTMVSVGTENGRINMNAGAQLLHFSGKEAYKKRYVWPDLYSTR